MKTFVIGDVHGRRAQLENLLRFINRDEAVDRLVFLGDLIDRGLDAPGVVEEVYELQRADSEGVVCVRGNHEQMLIDFIDAGDDFWLTHETGSHCTLEQYTGRAALAADFDDHFAALRRELVAAMPVAHLQFLRSLPIYDEDDYAIYVHAGLAKGQHPRDTAPRHLMWSRDNNFFKHYTGKPCVFGHTPTNCLPLRGRVGRHGIYTSHSAIGLDTSHAHGSPLSCLRLPDCTLYQAFADGRTIKHRITKAFIPEPLRAPR